MKKILITRKLIKESEDKASKTFDAIFNSNDELYSQSRVIEMSRGCDGILSSLTEKLDKDTIEKLPDTGFLKVEVERPSMDQLDAWAIECDRHVSSALSRSGKIKVDALSQIAKGVKNEFIEPVVAHRARLQLDDLSLSSENFLKVIGMTRKVHFLGYGLQLSTDEENKILSQTRQPIFKKVGEFMEG